MPLLRVVILASLDGEGVSGFPLVRRLTVDETQGFQVDKPGTADATYSAVPTGELATLQHLIFTTDTAVTLRLNGQSDAGIVLGAGGVVLLLGATLTAGAATNATVNNSAAASVIAALRGVAAGT